MNKKHWRSISEIFFLLGIISLWGALYLLWQNLGIGMYEPSIFHQFPLEFWLLFFTSTFLGVSRVLLDIGIIQQGYRWVWGIGLLVVLVSILIALPIFCDYEFHGHYDSVVHFSQSQEILRFGIPSADDIYPVSHIWASSLAQMSGANVRDVTLYMPLLVFFIGMCNLFFLAFMADQTPEVRGFIILLGILPAYSFPQTMFYPLQFALYEIWLFLGVFLLFRKEGSSQRETLLFVLILLLLPFLHPLGAVSSMLFLLFHLIEEIIAKRGTQESPNTRRRIFEKIIYAILIIFVSWFTWFSGFRVFGVATNTFYQSLFHDLGLGSVTDRFTDVVEVRGSDFASLFELTILTYGQYILFGLLLLGAIYTFLRNRDKFLKFNWTIMLFSSIFYFAAASSFVVDLIASFPTRYLNYAICLLPVLLAPIFIKQLEIAKSFWRYVSLSFYSITFLGIFLIGSLNMYFSDYVGNTNQQFSEAEMSGYEYIAGHSSSGDYFSPVGRTRAFFALGAYSEVVDTIYDDPIYYLRTAPAHLDFSLDQLTDRPEYLIVRSFERALFKGAKAGTNFLEEDFLKLEESATFDRVYDSGDMELFFIRSEELLDE
jgi:hypothetical protein